ncbi:MAG: Zn-ribbon domain-containing OB-fold protein [Acidimicrobiales bacterium]
MPDVRARYPQLIRLGGDDRSPPVIVGQECLACGRRSFPPDPYGCEACGATVDRLTPTELAATGVIHAVATVHRHHHPRPETPFTVVTVVLDDGVTLKGVLAGDPAAARVGARVQGVTVPWDTDDDGTEVVDLRFEVVADRS